jgi:hypothetical protein
MKKLILTITIAALASVASLQAGEGKECAKACDKATAKATECSKTAKATECSKTAKAAECTKTAAGKSCCAAKKTDATAKGATQLLAKR